MTFENGPQANFTKILNQVLPPRCSVTGELVDEQGMIAPKAWAELNFIAYPFCRSCGVPFGYEAHENLLCTNCIDYPPSYDMARAALLYDDVSRNLVLRFKHADELHVVASFVPWLMRAGEAFWEEADVIMPVPLHRWRLLRRRYNQAGLLAKALSRETKLPYEPLTLMRSRATQTQGHLGPKERYKNVKKAFAVDPKCSETVKGKVVVLVDDVLTTGATVNECAKALKKAGAKKVYVLTLARTKMSGTDF